MYFFNEANILSQIYPDIAINLEDKLLDNRRILSNSWDCGENNGPFYAFGTMKSEVNVKLGIKDGYVYWVYIYTKCLFHSATLNTTSISGSKASACDDVQNC